MIGCIIFASLRMPSLMKSRLSALAAGALGVRTMATLPYMPGSVKDDGSVTPHKPLSDKRDYRVVTLPNRLKVALIHDPAVDKSAACLTVAVGNLTDPWHLPGLSHFLEHMLFLGTNKFPEELSYKKFLKDHGGGSNASTSSEATTYHFFVHHASLLGDGAALDRFTSFFTGPLMDQSATERELNAVDSENSKNLNDDGRREWQVRKHLSAPGHVFLKFGTGDRKTLSPPGVDVRSALLEHYHKHYSSNIMAAAVLGRESLNDLEAAARVGLSGVVDKDVPIPVARELGNPYQTGQVGRVAFLKPVRDIRALNMVFPMPATPVPDMSHASRLLSHTIGYEGPGSLLSALKARGWANGLSAGHSSFRQHTYFNVEISLTPEGLAHIDELVRMVLEYLAVVQRASDGEWERIHAELRQTADNAVRFKPTTEPVSAVTSIATSLVDYEPIHVLTGRSLLPELPDLRRLKDMLACLTPSNMLLLVAAQNFGPENMGMRDVKELTEPYYSFGYSVAPFSAAQRGLWGLPAAPTVPVDASAPPAAPEAWTALPSGERYPGVVDLRPAALDAERSALYGAGLAMPPDNPYIPSDFELRPLEGAAGAGLADTTATATPGRAAETVAVEGDAEAIGSAPSVTPGATPVTVPVPVTPTPVNRTAVGVAALQGDQPAQTTVDVVAAEAPTPSAVAASAVLSSDGASPSPAGAGAGAGGTTITSPGLLGLHPNVWDVVVDTAQVSVSSPAGSGAMSVDMKSLLAVPMRPEFASKVFTFPAVYPEPKVLDLGSSNGDGATAQASGVSKDTAAVPASSLCRIWYHQDDRFRLPKTYATAIVRMADSKHPGGDPVKRVCAALACNLIHEVLNEPTYDARCAGLGYSLDAVQDAGELTVGVSGFSHTLPVLLKTVLERASRVTEEPEAVLRPAFDRLKDQMVRRLANFTKAQPHSRASELVAQYTQYPYLGREEALEVTKAISLEQVLEYAKGLVAVSAAAQDDAAASGYPAVPLELMVTANTDAGDAKGYARTILDSLAGVDVGKAPSSAPSTVSGQDVHAPASVNAVASPSSSPSPVPNPDFKETRALLLAPGKEVVITRQHPNPAEPNAAVEVVWMLGPSTARMRSLGSLLAQAWSQPAFDTLRTKEQLGYMVFSGTTTIGEGDVTAAYITVQGQAASVEHLQSRIEAFATSFRQQLDTLSEEEFRSRADIVAHRMTEPTKTQSEAHGRLKSPLESKRYEWHMSEATAAAVRGASLTDLKHLYDSAIMPNGPLVRKVVARVYAQAGAGAGASGAAADSTPTATESPAQGQAQAQARVLDGGPSKVPSPHPHEAPTDMRQWRGAVVHTPQPLALQDTGITTGTPAGRAAVGLWAPLLRDIPPGVKKMV